MLTSVKRALTNVLTQTVITPRDLTCVIVIKEMIPTKLKNYRLLSKINTPESGYEIGNAATDKHCTDIDECAEETHDCGSGAICENFDSTFKCTCDKGKCSHTIRNWPIEFQSTQNWWFFYKNMSYYEVITAMVIFALILTNVAWDIATVLQHAIILLEVLTVNAT